MTKQERELQKYYIEELKDYIQDGTEITVIHKTRCAILVLVPGENETTGGTKTNHIHNITYNTAKALGYTYNSKSCAIIMGGCGYSRAYQIKTDLESVLGVKNISKNEIYL